MDSGTAGEPVVVKLPSEIDVTNSGAARDTLLGALRNSALRRGRAADRRHPWRRGGAVAGGERV